jgi:peptidoglycan hydrolase-like protein with peptidoglycan-binding domain
MYLLFLRPIQCNILTAPLQPSILEDTVDDYYEPQRTADLPEKANHNHVLLNAVTPNIYSGLELSSLASVL